MTSTTHTTDGSTPPTGQIPDADIQPLDVEALREQFPILHRQVNGKPLIYLDNAATAQKPLEVIDAVNHAYRDINANVHRGVHHLSQEATFAYERGRGAMARLLHAPASHQIIFVRGATEGINLIAQSYARTTLSPGDQIMISHMEHHSNIVPWQMICEATGAELAVVPITDIGELDMEQFEAMLSDRVKIVAMVHISNSLGTINPIRQIIERAHDVGAVVMVDASQSVQHMPVDVQALDADFLVCSGHKMFGPTGIGIVYGKESLLEKMPPYQGGGDMIASVSFEKTTYAELPHKFEAGTPHIAGGIGLGAAADFISKLDWPAVMIHEQQLRDYAHQQLSEIDGLRLIGTAPHKSAVFSFVHDKAQAHDLGTILDTQGVAVRTGHHCTQPVMERFGLNATARASFAMYNTREEVDRLIEAMHTSLEMLI